MRIILFFDFYYMFIVFEVINNTKNLEVDEYTSKENLFEQSALLMNESYVYCFFFFFSINLWNNYCIWNELL